MKKFSLVLSLSFLSLLCLSANVCHAEAASEKTIYDFQVTTIDGKLESLSQYKGKVLLIVNTASECGFTPQYEALEQLFKKYKDQGLVVLGFPSNNFGGQEPGSNKEIKAFCEKNYKVNFPLFSKVDVKGSNADPLFKFLTKKAGGSIMWNFEKFIIGKDGHFVDRFRSITKPDSKKIIKLIETKLSS